MFLAKKWGFLIKRESESLIYTGLKIPRDYIKLEEEEKRRQEAFDNQLTEAENSILKKNKVENVKTDKGGSLFLELFKANGIKLPLRTQGWVNDILAEVAFKFDGSITYCYYSRGSDSKVFRDYLHKLEQRILEKHNICSDQN